MNVVLPHVGSRIGSCGPDANVRKKALARHDVALESGVQQLKPKSPLECATFDCGAGAKCRRCKAIMHRFSVTCQQKKLDATSTGCCGPSPVLVALMMSKAYICNGLHVACS